MNTAPPPKHGQRLQAWQETQADMQVKAELWQDGPGAFEVACWRLGASVPTLYKFDTIEKAGAFYLSFVQLNKGEPEIASKLQVEVELLHSLCASAQCWLDAAGHLAPDHHKAALQANADAFRQAYAKITS